MSKCYASKVIKLAKSEVGYLEKETNKNLDSKTTNAGDNNYTKYARDLDALGDFYNGKKNGYAWCDMFVDWLFYKAYGREDAQRLLCQPDKSYGAGCANSYEYYKKAGRVGITPKIGAQIFFVNVKGKIYHTGIVVKVDDTYVYTIEGNTSSASGVVENGGAVRDKKYKRNYVRIKEYGYPDYDEEPVIDNDVLDLQNAINIDLKPNPRLVEDNELGPKTMSQMKKVIIKKPMVGNFKTYPNIIKFVQAKVGTGVDGIYGKDSVEKVKAYQKKHGLKVDGIVGYNTLYAMVTK